MLKLKIQLFQIKRVTKKSKAKDSTISTTLVIFVVIIGIIAIAGCKKNGDIGYAPEYNSVETEKSTTEDL